MAKEKKPRGSDAKLARLHAMRNQPAASETTLELRRYLADASSFIVAEAAKIIKDQAVPELAGDLVAAFDRLMIDPEESDKQCRAKIEIVDALNQLEYAEPDVFLRGLTHRQDPRFGLPPGQDAAGALRAFCALGLARINHPGVVLLLTELLLDSDNTARAGAARARRHRARRRSSPALQGADRRSAGRRHRRVFCFAAQPVISRNRCRSWPGICGLGRAGCKGPPCSPWPRQRRPEAFAVAEGLLAGAPAEPPRVAAGSPWPCSVCRPRMTSSSA